MPEWFYWLLIAGLLGIIVGILVYVYRFTKPKPNPKKRHKTGLSLTVK